MTSMMPQHADVVVVHEIDLGRYRLLLLSDQSIDVMRSEEAPSGAENVLNLDSCEAYHLMISLQQMFKEVCE